MRCRFCGSTAIHPDSQRKNFSTGKAIAGAVTFGYVGAAAGLIGKDQKGYRCASCGSFMESPMDAITESSVNNAVIEAETGRSANMLNYYRRQYPNIQANIPVQAPLPSAPPAIAVLPAPPQIENDAGATIKRIYAYDCWEPDAPVYVDAIILRSSKNGDELSLRAWNQSKSVLRSLYFKAEVYDDTQDKVSESECVYQALNVEPGMALPESVSFSLHTSVAYTVVLHFEKAALIDGSVWRTNPEQASRSIRRLPQNELTEDTFPRLKYVREQLSGVSKIDKKAPLFLPTESDEHWQCICGHPSLAGEKCRFCGASLTQVENTLDQGKLQDMQKKAVMARAASRAKEFTSKINAMNEEIYAGANELEKTGDPEKLLQAAGIYESLKFYKDSTERAVKCRENAAETEKRRKEEQARKEAEEKAKKEATAKKMKKAMAIGIPLVAACIAMAILVTKVIIPNKTYNRGMELLGAGKYDEAINTFIALGDYKDSNAQIEKAKTAIIEAENAAAYEKAVAFLSAGDYDKAIDTFTKLGNYQDSAMKLVEAKTAKEENAFSVLLNAFIASNDINDRDAVLQYIKDNKAFSKVLKIADSGDSYAQYLAAFGYNNPDEVGLAKEDFQKAFVYAEKSAEQGNAYGINLLGTCYKNGEGVAKDYNKAFSLFSQAAEGGLPIAAYNLGDLYYYGNGVSQDYSKAFEWFLKAAEGGAPYAQSQVGAMYLNGEGVAQDNEKGVFWTRKGAENGDITGQRNLGISYYYGMGGLTQDYKESARWLKEPADYGDVDSQFLLGVQYYYGRGVEEDEAKAVYYFRLAARQGDQGAQDALNLLGKTW